MDLGHYILDENGEPKRATLMQWARWFETPGARVVKVDYFDHPFPPTESQIFMYTGGVIFKPAHDLEAGVTKLDFRIRVSTVFLGLDHNWSGEGPPILWETIVFGGPRCREMNRYDSRAAALAGHEEMCLLVQADIALANATEAKRDA